jgi:hypothetical protein
MTLAGGWWFIKILHLQLETGNMEHEEPPPLLQSHADCY